MPSCEKGIKCKISLKKVTLDQVRVRGESFVEKRVCQIKSEAECFRVETFKSCDQNVGHLKSNN